MIFDLWETLVDFDGRGARAMVGEMAQRLGTDVDEFRARWDATGNARYVGPMRPFLREFGFPEETLDDVLALRLEAVRQALVPRPGAVETLRELRRRGLRVGMISVCSEEVELAWPGTELAGLFDAEVFSCSFGACKPEPEIYLACCDALGVEPADAVFVGDGANDELAGARRVGMDAILIHRPGRDPYWPELRDWDGPRIDSIPGVLELLEEAPC